jgi:site-specific recombinase XerD
VSGERPLDPWIEGYLSYLGDVRRQSVFTVRDVRCTLRRVMGFMAHAHPGVRLEVSSPDAVSTRGVLEYVEHLRTERRNGGSAVNRQVTILKNFYRAMVAMGHLEPSENPMAHFPRIKAQPRKLPVTLSEAEVRKLLVAPDEETVLGVRDRAIITLLYGTGIRASECAMLREEDVDLDERTVTVFGKGGHQRTIPLNEQVIEALVRYRHHRGLRLPSRPFFETRSKRGISRGAIYERVRTHARRCGIRKQMSPHRLRHTFATHLVKAGVNLVTIRDLLGHRQITSTQVYLHVTAEDLREMARRHPIKHLAPTIEHLLPDVKLPMQHPPRRCRSG